MKNCPLWLCLFLAPLGCDQLTTPSLNDATERNQINVEKLLNEAKKLRSSVEKNKKNLLSQVAECDAIIAKLDQVIPGPVTPPNPSPNPAPPPNPAPKPEPAPNPAPPSPAPEPAPKPAAPENGRFGICRGIYDMAMTIKTDNLSEEAAQIASNFRAVSGLVKNGKTDSLIAEKQAYNISVELSKLNKPVTTAHPAWLPPAEKLGETIATLFNNNKILKNQDWVDMLDEVAKALEAVAKNATK